MHLCCWFFLFVCFDCFEVETQSKEQKLEKMHEDVFCQCEMCERLSAIIVDQNLVKACF